MLIGVGTLTGGGHRGHVPPPQPARKGASAQTARAMPVHAVIGLTMKYSRTSSYKVCSDRLTVRFFIATTKKLRPDTVIHAKRAWFTHKSGRGRKIFARASRANITMPPPPNHHHLPTPMIFEVLSTLVKCHGRY